MIGLKAFMSDSGIEDFAAADDLTLFEGMALAAALGLLVAVHAERPDHVAAARPCLARCGPPRRCGTGRPGRRSPGREAIARAIPLAEAAGCALHVVHVSTGRGVALVAARARRGVDVTCETCPHYLLLSEDDVERLGAVAKCAPPLRPAAERDALWTALTDGRLPN